MSYTKLAKSILTSTLWMEDDHTRIAWLTMLAMADKNGEVQASIPGLANVARIPVESARAAIVKFLSPDPDSRTKDDEGRRIQEIKGGWLLINHAEYRQLASDEDRKAKAAERQQRMRDKLKRNAMELIVTQESHQKSQADTDTDTDTDTDNKEEVVDAVASPHPPHETHPIEAIPNPQTPSSAAPLSPCPPAPKKPRPRDTIMDAIVTACGGDPMHQTQSQWTHAAKAKKEILEVDPNVTPTQIVQFGIRKRREWQVATCSPSAITKHWESQQAGSPASSEGDPFEGRAVVPYEEVRDRFGEGQEAVRIVAMLESQGRIQW